MPVNSRELIEAIQLVSEDHNIRATVKYSLTSSALVAGSTFAGAILLGPLGIPIGATAGGLYAYCKTKNKFKSVALIIRDDLTEEQKERLCEHIVEAFREFRPEDLASLAMIIPMLTTPGHFQTIALSRIVKFFTDEMRMHIID